ncbi:MAG: nucleotide exchange factor GrpE [Pyrinomonadaceae bacterium]|nr:nucleotide exchange factor GrpE [Pyrinomonadaceae bacterium]
MMMRENKGIEENSEAHEPGAAVFDEIRVTDRRRINLENESDGAPSENSSNKTSSFKPSYVEELEARTRAAEQKTVDVQNRFEQVRAELRRETDEIRQRLNRAADERVGRDKAAFVQTLIPVIDNLRRAMEAADGGGSLEALMNGLRGTVSGFESALAGLGVEPIAATGQMFDPQFHEAVDAIHVDAARDGMITTEYSRGYKMGDQLLRPARVQVGRALTAAQQAAE